MTGKAIVRIKITVAVAVPIFVCLRVIIIAANSGVFSYCRLLIFVRANIGYMCQLSDTQSNISRIEDGILGEGSQTLTDQKRESTVLPLLIC